MAKLVIATGAASAGDYGNPKQHGKVFGLIELKMGGYSGKEFLGLSGDIFEQAEIQKLRTEWLGDGGAGK